MVNFSVFVFFIVVLGINLGICFCFSIDMDFLNFIVIFIGLVNDGEVEDYLIMIGGFDYGDLLDVGLGVGEGNYEIIMVSNGLSYMILIDFFGNVLLKIGVDVDIEGDGQLGVNVDGDGLDEDGFDFISVMFVWGELQDIIILVMNMIGGDVKLMFYVDWDNDGDFNELEEMIFVMVVDGQISVILSNVILFFYVVLNDDFGFCLCLIMDVVMSLMGFVLDGEVEDYLIIVMVFDYGDLVDSGLGVGEGNYEMSSVNGGLLYKIVMNEDDMVMLKIGVDVDVDVDGQFSVDVDGDGVDEDGFDLVSVMFVVGQMLDIDILVMNMIGSGVKLMLYIDWDNDGDFSDLEEMFFVSVFDGINGNVIFVDILVLEDVVFNIGFGFCLCLIIDVVMSLMGFVFDGEVEDYEIMVMGFDYGDLFDLGVGINLGDYEIQDGSNGFSYKIVIDLVIGDVILKIGIIVDVEVNGQQSVNVDGDGVDEDGVSLFMFVIGMLVNVLVNVMNMMIEVVKLIMFVDWNNDGDFEDDNEMYLVDVFVGVILVEIEDVMFLFMVMFIVLVGVWF